MLSTIQTNGPGTQFALAESSSQNLSKPDYRGVAVSLNGGEGNEIISLNFSSNSYFLLLHKLSYISMVI